MDATLWSSLSCWFTPKVLFVVINVVIGTIAVVSKSTETKKKEIDGRQAAISRAPSVLHRLRSFDFSPLYDHHQPQEHTATGLIGNNGDQHFHHAPAIVTQPSFLQRVRSIRLYRSDSMEVQDNDTTGNSEQAHDQQPTNTPAVSRQPSFLQRMRSIKLYREEIPPQDDDQQCPKEPTALPEEQQHIRRSMSDETSTTVKNRRKKVMGRSVSERGAVEAAADEEEEDDDEGGEEVDARADDFINRFRQQLRLQRLDSILRYTEMLKRGTD